MGRPLHAGLDTTPQSSTARRRSLVRNREHRPRSRLGLGSRLHSRRCCVRSNRASCSSTSPKCLHGRKRERGRLSGVVLSCHSAASRQQLCSRTRLSAAAGMRMAAGGNTVLDLLVLLSLCGVVDQFDTRARPKNCKG